jgi:hypothetical protein
MIRRMISLVLLLLSAVAPLACAAPAAPQDRPQAAQAGSSVGDWYFREEIRWERFVFFLRTASKVRQVNELWIGEDRAAYLEPGRRIVLDRSRRTFTYLNTSDRTYVQWKLPLDGVDLFSPELERERRELSYGAAVEPTGRSRKIRGYECREYSVTTWAEREGRRDSFESLHVWATTELEVDHALVEQLIDLFRRLQPRTAKAVEQLGLIRGIQLRIEYDGPGNFVVRERLVAEDVEIIRRTPPSGIYEVPDGYTRKQRLTPGDL